MAAGGEMSEIRVVHKHKIYDITSPRPYIYIGRPSKWGNPFVIGRDGTRDEVIAKYREWIVTQPHLIAALPELKGADLACYCAPKPCHGNVLKELAEREGSAFGTRTSTSSTPSTRMSARC